MPDAAQLQSALLDALQTAGLSEVSGMNMLQSEGIVSDNAVHIHDLAAVDCEKAIEWVKQQFGN